MGPLRRVLLLWCILAAQVHSQTLLGRGSNCNDKKTIVNHHNHLRRLIAQSKVAGQPRSSDMKVMVWDDKLEKLAQGHANRMQFQHNDRRKDERFSVGENLFTVVTTSPTFSGYNWTKAIQEWFDEYKVYKFGSEFSVSTGHYTQVVWADTTRVGCGASYYRDPSGLYNHLYVCNYGPAGNYIGVSPYKIGNGCYRLCCPNKTCPTKYYGARC